MPNLQGLDINKEQVIIKHILKLNAQGFSP
jgi:hypothetical protein